MGYLHDCIDAALARDPNGRALQFDGAWITWSELRQSVEAIDEAIARLGLGEGGVAACALRNRPAHAAAILAMLRGGHCLLTLNALAPDDQLAQDVRSARAPVVVAAAQDWDRPAFRRAVAVSGAAGLSLTGDFARPVELVAGLERPVGGGLLAPRRESAILMLTSGTTGPPKRVPLQRAVLERQLDAAAAAAAAAGEEAAALRPSIVHSSFVHISGVWNVVSTAMSGRPLVLLERFSVEAWRAAIVEHRPKQAGLPPAALRMILDADPPREDLASLAAIGSGSAPLDPALVDTFQERYGVAVLGNYGATEFAGSAATWSLPAFRKYWSSKRGAAGRINKGVEARIVDPETGAPRPLGEEGALELRGASIGSPEAWIRTTDRAVLDADRFLWIKGRLDSSINRGGFKVQPDEVARVLELHPAVREAGVVGVPDARLGEVPVAAIALRAAAEPPSEAALSAHVRRHLLPYCVPVAFHVLPEIPRTPSMKVSSPALRAALSAGGESDAGARGWLRRPTALCEG
ncbi:class I adenylate-forming enzyme family protein [Phenylobacterium sp. LjRoot219]|uniref:class I adenylate-forming enzyme family protein n=1 Tax=Phenylobacterium sp. LjRoot219 TaxID=3342283 RepID=UPI003ECE6C89